MSVASHLGIDLREYDARIRTFIPDYDEMLDAAGDAVPTSARTIVDLGAGTGALAARCLERAPRARIVAIDADAEILAAARRRLRDRAHYLTGSFLQMPVPAADAVVASLALHHVRTRRAKAALYERIHAALRRAGRLVLVDCQPASEPTAAARQFRAWTAHLRRSYSPGRAANLLAAWAHEDVYVPLDAEIALLERAGFAVDVLWRKGAFAVLMAVRRNVPGRTRGSRA